MPRSASFSYAMGESSRPYMIAETPFSASISAVFGPAPLPSSINSTSPRSNPNFLSTSSIPFLLKFLNTFTRMKPSCTISPLSSFIKSFKRAFSSRTLFNCDFKREISALNSFTMRSRITSLLISKILLRSFSCNSATSRFLQSSSHFNRS